MDLTVSAETNQNEAVANGADSANAGAATDTTTDKATETETSVEQLKQQLAEEQKKASGYMEGWQRARADYDNLKRRSQLEKTAGQSTASSRRFRACLAESARIPQE